MKRNIVHIHEDKCNGCGICIDACHEGAIALVNGVAKLVSDIYCDGLGACLPNCPTGAIEIIEREADAFDEAAVEHRMAELKRLAERDQALAAYVSGGSTAIVSEQNHNHGHSHHHGHGHGCSGHDHGHAHAPTHVHAHAMGGCPGSMAKRIDRSAETVKPEGAAVSAVPEHIHVKRPSELQQWPVQISLVNPSAPFFENANLLVAADCTAYAYADFHRDFIKDHITVIGCPKLDDNAYYAEKLAEILSRNTIRSITVVRMVVPCCSGIVQSVKQAMLSSGTIVPYREVTVGIDGNLIAN